MVVDVNQDSFPAPIREVGRGRGCEAHLTFDFSVKTFFLESSPHFTFGLLCAHYGAFCSNEEDSSALPFAEVAKLLWE